MNKRYSVQQDAGRFEVYDSLTKRTLSRSMFRDAAEQICEALNLCHDFYDKPLNAPIRAISKF